MSKIFDKLEGKLKEKAIEQEIITLASEVDRLMLVVEKMKAKREKECCGGKCADCSCKEDKDV